LSIKKRDTYLKAEFPHLWPHISRFVNGKAEYSINAIRAKLGVEWESICNDLASIGVLQQVKSGGQVTYRFPQLYRKGLEITQGRA
jgi:hypothetical protein